MKNYKIQSDQKTYAKTSGEPFVGVQKDPIDERDLIVDISTLAKADLVSSTRSHSLMDLSSEIENQLDTGSCVANAACSALEIMALDQGKSYDFSRLFAYWNLREPYPELIGQDVGSYPRDAFKTIKEHGVPVESSWKFIKSNVNIKPGAEIYIEALSNLVIRYERVETLESIKALILDSKPVLFGIALGETFFSLSEPLADQRYKKINQTTNKLAGYHAMTIIGYDDDMNGGSFIIENSWSENWGDWGYCAISYSAFFADAMDAWVCTSFEVDLEIEPKKKEELDDNNEDNNEDNEDKNDENDKNEDDKNDKNDENEDGILSKILKIIINFCKSLGICK